MKVNAGNANTDEVVFTLRVASDPANKAAMDAMKREMEAMRRDFEKPINVPISPGRGGGGYVPGGSASTGGGIGGPAFSGAGGSAYAAGSAWRQTAGGGGGARIPSSPSDDDSRYGVSRGRNGAPVYKSPYDYGPTGYLLNLPDEEYNRRFSLARQNFANARNDYFNQGFGRFAGGIGQTASAVGMAGVAFGADLGDSVRTLAAVDAGVTGIRGIRAAASGVGQMVAAGGVGGLLGRGLAGAGFYGAAAAGGAALGYGLHYLRSSDQQRGFLNQDITDTLGITSVSQNALAASEQFTSRIDYIADRERRARGAGYKLSGGLGQYQFSTDIQDAMNAGNIDGARQLMKDRLASLGTPITEGGDLSARNTQRLEDRKNALEAEAKLEEQIAQKRRQGLEEKLSYEKYATSELERQLSLEQQKASAARSSAELSQEAWADMTPGQRARADKGVADVLATGTTDKANWRYLDMVAPELGAQARRNAAAKSFAGTATEKYYTDKINTADAKADNLGAMVAAGNTAIAKLNNELGQSDVDLKSKIIENRKAMAEVLRMIIEDTLKNMREEMDRKFQEGNRNRQPA